MAEGSRAAAIWRDTHPSGQHRAELQHSVLEGLPAHLTRVMLRHGVKEAARVEADDAAWPHTPSPTRAPARGEEVRVMGCMTMET